MGFDFKPLYEFHGHRCPMSTMGARMGLLAMSALGVTKADQFSIKGRFLAVNCALDGIQFVTGCTMGNGNLAVSDEKRAEFRLGFRDGSRGVAVSASAGAIERMSRHKKKKALLLEGKTSAGEGRASEIDLEMEMDFMGLVDWVQSASDEELLTVENFDDRRDM